MVKAGIKERVAQVGIEFHLIRRSVPEVNNEKVFGTTCSGIPVRHSMEENKRVSMRLSIAGIGIPLMASFSTKCTSRERGMAPEMSQSKY